MKLEPLLERPIVASAWQTRPGVRESSPTLDADDIISLTTRVSKMQLQSEMLGLDEDLAKLSLNITSGEDDAEEEKDCDTPVVETKKDKVAVDISVVKKEERKVLVIVTTREDGEDEVVEEGEEKDEEGVLHPRSPMKRERPKDRGLPYQQHQILSYSLQNIGQCSVRDPDESVTQLPSQQYTQFNIYGGEDIFAAIDDIYPPLAGSEGSSPQYSDHSCLSPPDFLVPGDTACLSSSPPEHFYADTPAAKSDLYQPDCFFPASPPNNYLSSSPGYTYQEASPQQDLTLQIQTDHVTLHDLDCLGLDDLLLNPFVEALVRDPVIGDVVDELIRDEGENGDNIPTTVAELSSPDNSPPTPSDLGYFSSRSTDSPSPRNIHVYTGGYSTDESSSCLYPPTATPSTTPGYIHETSADSFSANFSHVAIRSPEVYSAPCNAQSSFGRPVPTAATRILPKPQSSDLPPATARLKDKLNERVKTKIWTTISLKTDDELTTADEDGDTKLMVLIANPKVDDKLEYIYALVERFKKIRRGLTSVNNQGYSVLELTALFYDGPDPALIARYIAESLVNLGVDVNELNNDGDTLLHVLCKEGDAHAQVLSELLAVKDANGRPAFDLNKYNRQGRTAIQEAVAAHGQVKLCKGREVAERIRCVATILLLMRSGANATLPTIPEGRNLLSLAISSSCDDGLVALLLADPALVLSSRMTTYRENTCLHMVAARNDIPVQQQARCYGMLVEKGWGRKIFNEAGRCPLDLVDQDRREEIRSMLQPR